MERRQARLLSALLLLLTLSNISGALFTPENLQTVRMMLGYSIVPLFLCYLLSRTSYYLLAAIITIPILMSTSYVSLLNMEVYSQAAVAEIVMWLLLPMCVAVITLPWWWALAFLGANALLLGAMPVWMPALEPIYLSNGLSFVIIASFLLLVIAAMRKRDVDELHAQSSALQQQKHWLELEIRERQQAEMQVDVLQTLINGINEAVLLVSTDGVIERVNDTAMKMFGYNSRDFIDSNITRFVEHSRAGSESDLLECFLREGHNGHPDWHEFVANKSSGQTFPAEAYAALIEMDGSKRFVVTVRDMTEHKRIERMKDEFVSSVSHELRTPLTSIHGAISIINGMYRQELSDKVIQLIDIAYENGDSLSSLVDDILDISKLEAGHFPMHMDALNLAELMHEVVRGCTPLAEKFSIRFNLPESMEPITLETDRIRFTQVMRNLLSNAAKFSPPGDAVEVAYGRQDARVHISVTDHGAGIPEELQGKIFDKFFQVHTTSKQARSGTGLGLSISKKIVENMGGRLWVESRPGETVFRIELPLQQAGSVPVAAQGEMGSNFLS